MSSRDDAAAGICPVLDLPHFEARVLFHNPRKVVREAEHAATAGTPPERPCASTLIPVFDLKFEITAFIFIYIVAYKLYVACFHQHRGVVQGGQFFYICFQ